MTRAPQWHPDVVLKSRRAALRDPPLADCSLIITRGGVPEHRRLADREIGEPDRPVEHRRAPPEDPKFNAWLEARTPAGRWGKVEELQGACTFLASAASDFVDGRVIYVDGAVLATL